MLQTDYSRWAMFLFSGNIAEGCPHQYLYKHAPWIGMKTDIVKLCFFKEQDCVLPLVSGNKSQ